MASWVLKCPNCNSDFARSLVEDTLVEFFFPSKPPFPDGGKTLDCPNCGYTAAFQRNELIYRA